jgi:hypothetical protein
MLYQDMTPQQLRESYLSYRRLLANASAGRMAASTGRCLRQMELIERIADKRRISLS